MTKQTEALKAAIKAMENSNSISYEMMHAIADCKEALAQPEQDAGYVCVDGYRHPAAFLHTAPPQREWVGLTDEEIAKALGIKTHLLAAIRDARSIESKLKEKNS